jgi:hypothetical protein
MLLSRKGDAVWQQLMLRLPPDVTWSRMLDMPTEDFLAYRAQLRDCQKLMRDLQSCQA